MPSKPKLPTCINCQSDEIIENDDEHPEEPFYCGNCGWWGMTANLVENPPIDSEENWRVGQVPKRPTE